jgi:hypothetical protein
VNNLHINPVQTRPIALPKVAAPASVRMFKTPAIPKVASVPKIAQVKIRNLGGNNFHVIHKMSTGPDKQFVFQDPNKMVTHLRRLERTAWLHPTKDTAPREAQIDNLGMTPV